MKPRPEPSSRARTPGASQAPDQDMLSTAAGAPVEEPSADDLTGKVLGDFNILRRLGQGGMGQVYLAEQLSLRRKVALKILKPELASNETSLRRFHSEATSVARATHANIVQVYAIGAAAGFHFMALEYVDGLNLRDYLNKKGIPDVLFALSLMRQVLSALARAAEMGIVHRDIKPENILLTRKVEVKVADFGLSRCFSDDSQPLKLTQTGVTMGTPLYMSPEQVQGQTVDPRSDIYSFGVTCYHMLAGHPPFSGKSAMEVAIQHVEAQAQPLGEVRPDLPAELCALVDRMMAKKPEDRFQTSREVLRELTRLRENLTGTTKLQMPAGAGGSAPSQATTVAAPPIRRRRRWQRWAVAASLVLAFGAGAAFAWKSQRSPSSAARTLQKTEADPEPIVSEEEKSLRREAERCANPGDNVQKLQGVKAYLNLGVYYLEQERWQEADDLFARMIDNRARVREYSELGRLGHAVVLAFQDQAKESNQLFLECKSRLDMEPMKRNLILNHPRLRPLIARALDHNSINCEATKDFPPALEPLRRPLPLPAPPRLLREK